MRAFNLNISADIDLSLPSSKGHYDIKIIQGIFSLPALEETKVHRAGSQAFYGSRNSSHYLIWPKLVAFQITDKQITYQILGNIPEGLLRIFILSEAMGILLHIRGYYTLHASAVQHMGQATVFLGTPGAGKSTTIAAFAKEGFHVLSDDLVVIAPTDPPTVLQAFPEIKIWKHAAIGLGLDVSALTPAWEGKEKYMLRPSLFSKDNTTYKLKHIKIITQPNDYNTPKEILGPVELLRYFPLPHQLLTPPSLKEHFEISYLILSNSTLSSVCRPGGFQELIKFVHEYKSLEECRYMLTNPNT
jgi:hypothetical protein